MYQRYCELKKQKNMSDADIHRATGIAKSTLSDWKNGDYTPKQDKLMLIAECLGVSIDYLMTGEESKFSKDRAILEVQITEDAELMKRLRKYMDLPQEKKDLILAMIDNL